MAQKNSIIYLWDAGGTLFPEKWAWKKYKNFKDFLVARYGRNYTDWEEEKCWEEAYRKGYENVTLNKGFKKVLSWTKNNFVLTAGNYGQIDARREVYLRKYNIDIKSYLTGVITRFDYKRKNLKKDRGLFKLVLQDYFKKGYREFIYTDDNLKNIKEFVIAAQELKKIKEYQDLKFRAYNILNNNIGLTKKKDYWEIGSLTDLMENEKNQSDNFNMFQQALAEDWYIQGFAAVPLFLNPTVYSGVVMGEDLGFMYDIYLLHYKHKYSEACYSRKELAKVWKIIKQKLLVDPQYLHKVSKKYYAKFAAFEKELDSIYKKKLSKISADELVSLFKKAGQAQIYSGGVAHVIEAISLEIEKEFKNNLAKKINNSTDFNQVYSILTAPTEMSFVAGEELELFKLKKLSGKRLISSLKKHANKYFWLGNSYAGYKILDDNYFLSKLKNFDNIKYNANIKKEKDRLIRKLKLGKKIKDQIKLIDFCTIWQDKEKPKFCKPLAI